MKRTAVAPGFPVWTRIAVVVVSVALLSYLLVQTPVPHAAVTGVVSAVVAFFAIHFNIVQSERLSRRQHTLTIIFQSRYNNDIYRDYATRLVHYTASLKKPFDLIDLEKTNTDNGSVFESARWILNYYEFIALGCYSGDLDIGFVKANLRRMVVTAVIDLQKVISARRTPEDGDPRTWEHLVWLFAEFADKEQIERILSKLGPPPTFLETTDLAAWKSRTREAGDAKQAATE